MNSICLILTTFGFTDGAKAQMLIKHFSFFTEMRSIMNIHKFEKMMQQK